MKSKTAVSYLKAKKASSLQRVGTATKDFYNSMMF